MNMSSTGTGNGLSGNHNAVPVVTASTIHELASECRRATKRTKTSTSALQQHVDNLMQLVEQFLVEHNAEEVKGKEGAHGRLFMKKQLPQFAQELKKLVSAVTTTFKDLHSQNVVLLGKHIDHAFVSDQEAYFDQYVETNGFQRPFQTLRGANQTDAVTKETANGHGGHSNGVESLFDEDVLRLVVMQHLVREGHFQVVDILEEEMMEKDGEDQERDAEKDADGDQQMNGESSSSSSCSQRLVAESYKKMFREMYDILNDMKEYKKLDRALQWCKNKEELLKEQEQKALSHGTAFLRGNLHGNVSIASKLANLNSLEFMLHKLRFIEILRVCSNEQESDPLRSESLRKAIAYSRLHLSPFSGLHMEEIRFLMGSLLYAKKIQNSPYRSLFDDSHWDRAIDTFKMECCAQEGQAMESPLYVALTAGSQALPTILKMLNVTKNKLLGQSMSILDMNLDEENDDDEDDEDDDYDDEDEDDGSASGETSRRNRKLPRRRQVGQLGVHIDDLDPSFTFHSVFACPVSKELTNDEDNPPMLLPCGHVLAKNSIDKLVRPPDNIFKCPYCPTKIRMTACKKIHF